MARHGDTPTGSLDLLLDAMCNTFGGIMFVALLLCIMSNLTDPHDFTRGETDDSAESERLRATLRERKRELFEVRQTTETLEVLAAAKEQPAERHTLERAALRRQLALQREALRRAEKGDASTTNRTAENLREQLAEARKALEELRKHSDSETVVRQKVRLPRARKTQKQPLWILVRGGKFILTQPRTEDGFSPRYDTRSLRVRVEDGRARLMPLPGAGEAPGTTAAPSAALEQTVRLFGANDRLFASFAVYPDSYDAFIEIRNYFVQNGIDYNWAPVATQEMPLILTTGTEFEVL